MLCRAILCRLYITGVLNDDKRKWVSVEEVQEYLGVTRDTIYRWIKHRNFPAHKTGRIYKAKLSEVDEWVKNKDGLSQGTVNE